MPITAANNKINNIPEPLQVQASSSNASGASSGAASVIAVDTISSLEPNIEESTSSDNKGCCRNIVDFLLCSAKCFFKWFVKFISLGLCDLWSTSKVEGENPGLSTAEDNVERGEGPGLSTVEDNVERGEGPENATRELAGYSNHVIELVNQGILSAETLPYHASRGVHIVLNYPEGSYGLTKELLDHLPPGYYYAISCDKRIEGFYNEGIFQAYENRLINGMKQEDSLDLCIIHLRRNTTVKPSVCISYGIHLRVNDPPYAPYIENTEDHNFMRSDPRIKLKIMTVVYNRQDIIKR